MSNSSNRRIPTRPLSYSKKHLATPKELLVDWNNGELWICNEKGEFVNITASEQEVIEETIRLIKSDPTILSAISVDLPDDTKVLISETIVKIIQDNENIVESMEQLSESIADLPDLKKSISTNASNIKNNTDNITKINESVTELKERDETLTQELESTKTEISSLKNNTGNIQTTLTETSKVAKENESAIDRIESVLPKLLKSEQIVISTIPFETNTNIPDTAILYIEVEE